ncbi:hypothetical protein FEV09_07775 [Pseudanabaena catenata USMAC16]|uniref:Uncharacterized protein n=1 Tax=Pseudanabaena catenata USMAC16 TaxID=1855837 RepID=A0A9X4MB09_9CYAN|nr:hypothetical protein [Pseudanabaena catenata]MDG3494456.1 hypothetical protein [Pseudanabaena catenata USMAC16]
MSVSWWIAQFVTAQFSSFGSWEFASTLSLNHLRLRSQSQVYLPDVTCHSSIKIDDVVIELIAYG